MILTSRSLAGALVACGLVAASLTAPGPVLAGSPDATKAASRAAATPARAVYVAGDGNDKVEALAIGATGALTTLGVKDLPAASQPNGVAVSPDGRHVYVTSYADDKVTHYPVLANGGLGTPDASLPTGDEPYQVELTPDGRYLFTGNYTGKTISRFRVNANGSLTSLGPDTPVSNGIYPFVISPNGKYLVYSDGLYIATMAISAAGGLTPVGAPVNTNVNGSYGLAVTPNGKFVFSANTGGNTVSGFSLGSTGILTPVGTPVPVGAGVNDIRVSPDGKLVFTADYNAETISVLKVLGNGALTAVGTPFPLPGKGPAGIAVTPSGKTLYVANFTTSDVSQLTVAPNGTLTQAPGSPFALAATTPEWFPITTTPNQGPIAKIKRIKKGKAVAGEKVTLKAGGSSDPDGKIVSYVWKIGGKTKTTSKPKLRFTFKKAKKYTVRLTVTDNEGCSDVDISTGHTLHCNGSTKAVTKIKVKVVKPA